MDIEKQIYNMYNSEEYLDLLNYYKKTSFFNILREARSESTHSNFLRWLFDSQGEHELNCFPVECLLMLLVNKSEVLDENIKYKILLKQWRLYRSQSEVEKAIDNKYISVRAGGKKGKPRIDILIEISFLNDDKILPIIIENKIHSGEHDFQTETYYNWGNDTYCDESKYYAPFYVFLSYDNQVAEDEHYINISYQDLLDGVLEPSLKLGENSYSTEFIENYIRCLSGVGLIENEIKYLNIKGKKGESGIMAQSKEEKELLKSFIDKNLDLFMAAVEAVKDDEDYEELSDHLRDLKAAMQTTKDRTIYLIGKEEISNKRKIAKKIFSSFIDKYDMKYTFQELQDLMKKDGYEIKDIYPFRLETDISDKGRFFSDISLKVIEENGENEEKKYVKYLVSNQYGAGDSFSSLIAYANKTNLLGCQIREKDN